MFASNSGVVSSSNVNGGNNDRRVLDVYSDGTVKIPYLGKIHVEGLTVQEAKTKIAAKFKEFSNFVTNTHIDVDVVLTNKFFSVVGELGNRRVQMNKDRLTIYQALAISGLISEQGNREKVYIIRQISSGLTEYKLFDLRSKDVIDSEYYWIQPNDVIYMPRRASMFWGKISSFWDVWATLSSVITLGTGIFLIWKQL
jgi:polysaccharide export outer membrane protein